MDELVQRLQREFRIALDQVIAHQRSPLGKEEPLRTSKAPNPDGSVKGAESVFKCLPRLGSIHLVPAPLIDFVSSGNMLGNLTIDGEVSHLSERGSDSKSVRETKREAEKIVVLAGPYGKMMATCEHGVRCIFVCHFEPKRQLEARSKRCDIRRTCYGRALRFEDLTNMRLSINQYRNLIEDGVDSIVRGKRTVGMVNDSARFGCLHLAFPVKKVATGLDDTLHFYGARNEVDRLWQEWAVPELNQPIEIIASRPEQLQVRSAFDIRILDRLPLDKSTEGGQRP